MGSLHLSPCTPQCSLSLSRQWLTAGIWLTGFHLSSCSSKCSLLPLHRQQPPAEVWSAVVKRLIDGGQSGGRRAGNASLNRREGPGGTLIDAMDAQQLVDLSAGLARLKARCVFLTRSKGRCISNQRQGWVKWQWLSWCAMC